MVKEKKEVPEKFKAIVEAIEKMSVLDLNELVKVLEERFGVSSVMPVGVGVVSQVKEQGVEEKKEEKTVFNIELVSVGSSKIQVIKVVRDITGKGLKESKDIVDAAEKSPQIIKENVKKEEAEEIKKKLEEAGAKVELK
jgi:large subunit ribosomal protein L7/L12